MTQARSDWAIHQHLRREGFPVCHLLHYLEMATEKQAEAYFGRSNIVSPRSHTGFVPFLRAVADQSTQDDPISRVLDFRRPSDLKRWIKRAIPLGHKLQSLARSAAADGPNPEYPWPHRAPQHNPASFDFPLWSELIGTGHGRKLGFMDRALTHFDEFA